MYKADLVHGTPTIWQANGSKAIYPEYTPSLYVAADAKRDLIDLRSRLAAIDGVHATVFEQWKRSWQHERSDVLRVDVSSVDTVQDIGYRIRSRYAPTQYQLYNIDLAPQFRYCLETDTDPTPQHELTTLHLATSQHRLSDDDLSVLGIDGDRHTGSEQHIIETVHSRLREQDPDVLLVSHSQLLPLLRNKARDHGRYDFRLGREQGFEALADASTYTQYGQRKHSPARYDVPGRAIINLSNSFFMAETDLHGILDLVNRSYRPIQETAWSSIGSVLTAIQIKHAYTNNVLVPWQPRRPEQPKSLRTLHQADRGGFIFSPQTGMHENVYEVDFASLYPNIICTRNISPDTIRCDCHDREDVPEIGYSVCDEDGFLPEVLQPIIDERQQYKQRIRETDDDEEAAQYQAMSDALKWILVSCFGYQGFANAKFGRIECHEAINAHAREIILQTKELFEQHGWRIVHGIIDSIWVQPTCENPTPIEEMCGRATEMVDIELEFEDRFDWIAFCSRSSTYGGALNRYFGITADDELVVKGIECRQRSTPKFIDQAQRRYIRLLDDTREPQTVIDAVEQDIQRLQAGLVNPEDLIITKRVSRPVEAYQQDLKNASAMERAQDLFDMELHAGMDTEYIVVDDTADGMDRIRLPHENVTGYDVVFYVDQLVRAAESVLSPFGIGREDITETVSETAETAITAYVAEGP